MALESKQCLHGQASYILEAMQTDSELISEILNRSRILNPEFVCPTNRFPSPICSPTGKPKPQTQEDPEADPEVEKHVHSSWSSDGYDDLESETKTGWRDEFDPLRAPPLTREIAAFSPHPTAGRSLDFNRYGFLPIGEDHVLVNNDFMLMNTWIKYYFDTHDSGRYMKRRLDDRIIILSGTSTGIVNYPDGSCDVSFNNYFVSQSVLFCDEVAMMHMVSKKKVIPPGNILSAITNDNDAACCVGMQYFPKPVHCKQEILYQDQTVYFWPALIKNQHGKCVTWNVSLELPFGLKINHY